MVFLRLCYCGCGERVRLPQNKYIAGHYSKAKLDGRKKRMSEETKRKISEANKGKKLSEEHKKILYETNKSRVVSEETKKKISKAKKGIPKSEEHKKKISETMKGRKLSEETRKKMIEGCKKRNMNPAYKNRQVKKGYKHTTKSRIKMSEVQRGRKGRICSEETRKKLSAACKGKNLGKENGNWKGGVSFENYCQKFNWSLKEKIRNRDNRTCQLCNTPENGKTISVHHIHYDKENCYPDLITLCSSCNSKVNSKRDYWEMYFMRQLVYRQIPTTVNNMETELNIWNFGEF